MDERDPAPYPCFSVHSEEEIDTLEMSFEGVDFEEDFGVFRKGEHIPYMAINYVTFEMAEYTEGGDRLRVQRFTIAPVREE